jgi:transcription elongation factor
MSRGDAASYWSRGAFTPAIGNSTHIPAWGQAGSKLPPTSNNARLGPSGLEPGCPHPGHWQFHAHSGLGAGRLQATADIEQRSARAVRPGAGVPSPRPSAIPRTFRPGGRPAPSYRRHRTTLGAGRQAWSRGALTPAIGKPLHMPAWGLQADADIGQRSARAVRPGAGVPSRPLAIPRTFRPGGRPAPSYRRHRTSWGW